MPKRDDYRLRPLAETDLEKVLEWRNSERIRANMYTDHIISMEEHRTWFDKTEQSEANVCLVFEYQQRPVGVVYATDIDRRSNKCSWGFYLGEVGVPRGSGAVMEYLALNYIFEILGMRKLGAEVFTFNTQVIKVHKKFGFVEEGCFVKHVLKNNKYEDVISMALFAEEWAKAKPKFEKLLFRAG